MFSTDHFHPMLVHFPIAIVAIGFLAELASIYFKKETYLPKMSFFLLIVGTLSAIVTVLSGLFFTSDMAGAAEVVRENHELLAFVTLILLVATSTLRVILVLQKKEYPKLKWLAFTLYFLAMISVSITGFFGGTLVYNYMMPL